ncbi:rod shape-determining protein RodA [Candidatus Uhrbacteria bacterium]|nr:rod shape-determining protein RodA [Candidatus Uhrbacteria bacterium]
MARLWEYLERLDWTLLAAAFTLAAVGLVAIYGIGVSQEPADLFLFHKQFVTFGIGVTIIAILIFLDYRHLRSYGLMLYLVGALLLAGVLIFGVRINATQGWFRIGTLSFQPVEIAKVTLAIYLAAFFVRRGRGRLSWTTFGISFVATSAYAGLVLLQPDFGSAMVLFLIWGIMALFAGLPRHAWIILPLVLLTTAGIVWNFTLRDYQRERIESFLDPERDPRGAGYNAIQARIAIGSGGWFGKGIGEGSQARLRFLPAAATDFIFAVVGEELGLAGIIFVFFLFGLILIRFIRLGYDSEDDFAALMLMGVGAVFLVHVMVNAGMNLGLMPITGIPMPFLSAAASYMLVVFVCVGLAESVAVRRRGLVDQAAGKMLFE